MVEGKMIDYIEGRIEYMESDSVTVGTGQGVGYRVFCPNPYVHKLGEQKKVFTHHYVREDAIYLFGFGTREERNLFRKLLDVSGIGPKGALAILAAAEPAKIVSAVQREDIAFLTKFPGIGKKTAGRLVLDLKDKLNDFLGLVPEDDQFTDHLFAALDKPGAVQSRTEAMEALKSLGYQEKEISKVMAKIDDETLTTEQLIKKALQLFIRG
jgi:holliday junction DNA helicase RuvA